MTAVVLAEPHTPAWHEARRAGIGASEIAAVLGLSPWESPFSMYWRKKEGWQTDLSGEMEWGTRLEDAIAQKYIDTHVDQDLHRSGLIAGPEPWMLATPDRLIARRQQCGPCDYGLPMGCGCSTPGDAFAVLELKTGHDTAEGWGENGTNQIPVYYRAQVQWQMLCTGLDDAVVAVLIGGSDYREFHVRRDDKDIAVMVEAGRRFMARLADDDPPPIDDHNATIDTLKRLHPDLEDVEAQVDDNLAASYLRAVRMRKLAEKVEQRYAAQLRAQAGPARIIRTADGRKVATHVIADVAAETQPRGPHRKDYLLASIPRGHKS